MTWIVILLAFLALLEIRKQWPVKGLHCISQSDLVGLKKEQSIKIIDLRETPDYYVDHLEDSIPVFIGRLPFVWNKHIAHGDSIVLLAQDRKMLKKAARILKKKAEVKSIYGLIYPEMNVKRGRCFTV